LTCCNANFIRGLSLANTTINARHMGIITRLISWVTRVNVAKRKPGTRCMAGKAYFEKLPQ